MANAFEPQAEAVHIEVNDRCCVESQRLTDDEAADDRDTERTAKLGARAGAERQRQTAEQRRHGGHHDGAEAQQTGLEDSFFRGLAVAPLDFEREVDHHNGVFLHDADQQNNADERNYAEFGMRDEQRENGSDARRG